MGTKVFISWSGEDSMEVAIFLRDWLPAVIQEVEPFVSSEDLRKGSRWAEEVGKQLEKSGFGIICLTPENLNSPWVLFEAGAISRVFGKNKVVPLLLGLSSTDIRPPLSQFQAASTDEEDFKKIIFSLNEACENSLEKGRLEKTFKTWWPECEKKLKEIEKSIKQKTEKPKDEKTKKEADLETIQQILEELVQTFRANQRVLGDPERLLPPDYLIQILNSAKSRHSSRYGLSPDHPIWREFDDYLIKISNWVDNEKRKKKITPTAVKNIKDYIETISSMFSFLQRNNETNFRR